MKAQIISATYISVRDTEGKVEFSVFAMCKMAISKIVRGKRAHLYTKFREIFLKLKQGTCLYVHVYMQACINA